MEEIKVGEYIRTKEDGICKLIAKEMDADYEFCGYVDKPFWLRENNIVKHSSNIIDLIEVGDWVNTYKILEIGIDPFNQKKILSTDCMEIGAFGDRSLIQFHNEDIKSIVTREQFELAKYEVI